MPAPPHFNGQWSGPLHGDTPGLGVLELDMENGWITGTAYLYPADPAVVPAAIKLAFQPMLGTHTFDRLPVKAFAPDLGQIIDRQQMAVLYPLSDISETANASLTFNQDGSVFVSFQTPITSGLGNLTKAHSKPSGLKSTAMTWDDFRDYVFKWQGKENFVFRGQGDYKWPLRTSFHRTAKKNLDRYTSVLIQETHKALVNKIGDKLDLRNADDLGSFYSILQHHGYPTPLLDWTQSAFIAAYFAFENTEMHQDGSVRIFALNKAAWLQTLQQNLMTLTRPHLSFVDLLARGNDRAGPQQSEFTVTNVDDIEAHIIATELRYQQQYLWAIDIHSYDRNRALADLDGMGVNRSLLFPDIDGICRSMRIKHFGVD